MKANAYKIIFLIFAIFLFISGCTKDLLEQTTPNDPVLSEFYKTPEEAILGINAAYSALQFFGVYNRYWNYVNSGRSDESVFTDKQAGLPEVDGLDDFTMLGVVPAVHETWRDNYKGVLKANLVLEGVPGIEFSDENLKNRILGEAYFLRALFHFNLITNFSEEIPMYTKVPKVNADFFPFPEEPGAIYDQIEADLNLAKGLLPNVETYRGTNDLGRISKGTAVTFLGKVYLFRGKYQQAANELYELINGSCGHYELVRRLRDNSDATYDSVAGYGTIDGPSVENNLESIFEVQYKLSPEGQDVWNISGENQNASEAQIIEQEMTMIDGTGGMWWNQKPTPKMLAEFEINPVDSTVIDPRYYKTFWCPGGDKYKIGRRLLTYNQYISSARNGQIGWRKWCRDYETSSWESDVNVRIFRLADVYLMYAECLIEGASPVGSEGPEYYIDLVRDRARNEPDAPNYNLTAQLPTVAQLLQDKPVINGITLDNLRDILRHERMVELAFEGKRWQDILRWNLGTEIFGSQFKPWLPIYTTDLQVNPNLKPNSSN